MMPRILCIEGRRSTSPSFVESLRKKNYQVEVVATGSEALERILDIDPDLIIIHAASLRTSGKKICRDLRVRVGNLPIILILGADQNKAEETCANVLLQLPFTARKLLNRLAPLLPSHEEALHVGPIRLEPERKKVRCQGREAHLTPRLMLLLRAFMEHAGEVLTRQQLFKAVWHTEYAGDTRSLDVHISWLREALEEDPRHPIFLKTIRGVGYRLDIP
ncbi:MAG: response regulator transcription factor [Anaerolineales bacterium]|jgi:DNA-binding response OmpR family regulator|nr:response regulator transcription factor [Anaerolineales bacterium]